MVAGGNLALIYFNVSEERLTLDEIEAAYPDLASALVGHPGIGLCWSARPTTVPSRWARRASTSSTRTASRARTRWPSTASWPRPPCGALTTSPMSATSPWSASTTQRPSEIASLRGAHRGPRWTGRPADAAVPALPVRLGARRGTHRGCTGGLPSAASLDGAAPRHDLRLDEGWRGERWKDHRGLSRGLRPGGDLGAHSLRLSRRRPKARTGGAGPTACDSGAAAGSPPGHRHPGALDARLPSTGCPGMPTIRS